MIWLCIGLVIGFTLGSIVGIVFKDGNPITIKFGEMQGKENKQ